MAYPDIMCCLLSAGTFLLCHAGKGKSSTVYLGLHQRTGKLIAMKEVCTGSIAKCRVSWHGRAPHLCLAVD